MSAISTKIFDDIVRNRLDTVDSLAYILYNYCVQTRRNIL